MEMNQSKFLRNVWLTLTYLETSVEKINKNNTSYIHMIIHYLELHLIIVLLKQCWKLEAKLFMILAVNGTRLWSGKHHNNLDINSLLLGDHYSVQWILLIRGTTLFKICQEMLLLILLNLILMLLMLVMLL